MRLLIGTPWLWSGKRRREELVDVCALRWMLWLLSGDVVRPVGSLLRSGYELPRSFMLETVFQGRLGRMCGL